MASMAMLLVHQRVSFFCEKEVIPKLGFPANLSDAFFFEHELIRNPPVWDGDMSCKKSPPYFDHQMSQGFSYSNRFEEFLLIDVYVS